MSCHSLINYFPPKMYLLLWYKGNKTFQGVLLWATLTPRLWWLSYNFMPHHVKFLTCIWCIIYCTSRECIRFRLYIFYLILYWVYWDRFQLILVGYCFQSWTSGINLMQKYNFFPLSFHIFFGLIKNQVFYL